MRNINTSFESFILESAKLDSTLKVYTIDKDGDTETVIFDSQKIEKGSMCSNCFSKHGQNIGCTDAGCYSFENYECSIKDDFYRELVKAFGDMDAILADNNLSKSDFIDMLNGEKSADVDFPEYGRILEFFKSWKQENENHTDAEYYTYFDGHNWSSVFFDVQFGDFNCYTEGDNSENIVSDYRSAEASEWNSGIRVKSGELYDYVESQYASTPWSATVVEKEEYPQQ